MSGGKVSVEYGQSTGFMVSRHDHECLSVAVGELKGLCDCKVEAECLDDGGGQAVGMP